MNKIAVILLVLVVSLTVGAEQRRGFKHSHIPKAVADLTSIGDLEETNKINLNIGLPLRNTEELNTLLSDLSNPASTNYHRWLTNGEFNKRFGPTTNDYAKVIGWAKSRGLSVTATNQDNVFLPVIGSVSDINKSFKVRLKKYHDPVKNRRFYSPDSEPTMDIDIPVGHIGGIENHGIMQPSSTNYPVVSPGAGPGSGPGGGYIGYDFRHAYIPGYAPIGTGQIIGITSYFNFYSSDINGANGYQGKSGLPTLTYAAGYIPSDADGGTGGNVHYHPEVPLDIDMAWSIAPGAQQAILVARDSIGTGALAGEWMTYYISKATSIKQWNNSYITYGGAYDSIVAGYLVTIYANGQSFFNCSGDYDAYYGNFPDPCDYPYVTSVGGTSLASTNYTTESVWNHYPGTDELGSGGGISTRFTIPSYQTGIDMTANLGSATMRNGPDVSMAATNIYVVYNGAGTLLVGTSAAAPLWTGICALINEKAVANGKPTVGFLNPAIYALGKSAAYKDCFHDITTGNNFWSSSPTHYPAVAGYDLCTGWGTPNGTNLINALYTGPTVVSLVMSNGLFIRAY